MSILEEMEEAAKAGARGAGKASWIKTFDAFQPGLGEALWGRLAAEHVRGFKVALAILREMEFEHIADAVGMYGRLMHEKRMPGMYDATEPEQ